LDDIIRVEDRVIDINRPVPTSGKNSREKPITIFTHISFCSFENGVYAVNSDISKTGKSEEKNSESTDKLKSRLEGVNRRNLKIIDFEHALHPCHTRLE
jgi:hypothetical protein